MGEGSARRDDDRRCGRAAQPLSRQDRRRLERAWSEPATAPLAGSHPCCGGGSASRCASAAAARRTSTASRPQANRSTFATCAGIVAYAPGELVVTARAGTPLAEIEDALRDAGQMLAVRTAASWSRHDARRHRGTGFSGTAPAACRCRPRFRARRAHHRRHRRIACVRRAGDQERRGFRRFAPDDRCARHARRADGDLAQVPAAAEGRDDARPRLQRRGALRWVNEWGGKPLPVSATCFVDGRLWRSPVGCAGRASRARSAVIGGEEADGSNVLARIARPGARLLHRRRRAAKRRCGGCRCDRRRPGRKLPASR